MNIFFQIIEFIITFIETYIGYLFISLFIEDKVKNKNLSKSLFPILSFILVLVTHYLNYNYKLFSFYTLFFNLFFICFSYCIISKKNFYKIFGITSFYYFLINTIDFVYITFIGYFMHIDNYAEILLVPHTFSRLYFICTVKLILILLYFLLKKFLYLYLISTAQITHFPFLAIFSFIGTLFLIYQTFSLGANKTIFFWIIFALCIIFLLSIFSIYSQYRTEKENRHLLELNNFLIQEKYVSLNEYYSIHAGLYHDLNNNLIILNNLITNQDYTAANNYINKLITPLREVDNTVHTGNVTIDFILNYKKAKAEYHGIKFIVNTEYIQLNSIFDNDLCTILFNLIDNALEACTNLPLLNSEKWIAITIKSINDMLILKIENTCQHEIDITNLKTTKKNKHLHGLGLQNVSLIVDKYNGYANYSCDNNIFCVIILLNQI